MMYARFIGVNRFLDPSINELAGCARDAAALYSIFRDGIDGLDSRLLQNEDATVSAVRAIISDLLLPADENDAIILTFATHGTHDHRIVLHDSNLLDYDDTTIPLEELVEAFKATRAHFLLIVLDCCFSGAAPARVVSQSPSARGLFNLATIEGHGKLILSACRMDEEAYEDPVKRHGILTAALIDALTQPHEGLISLVESVVARVRTDAAALGHRQNPTTTIYVDGGFNLTTLSRGATYRQFFPEYGALTTADILSIEQFGIPRDVIVDWSADYGNHLHQLQLDAINEFRVLDGESIFVVAPTSSGKTFIGEMAAIAAIKQGRKAVFLLPLKALASEKFDDFTRKYAERLGLRVIRCTGDYRDDIGSFNAGKFDIALLTYEMFLGLLLSAPAIVNVLGLVVIDEAQYIADPDRGATVELILTYFRLRRNEGIAPQLVLLSAVVGNVNVFSEWLGVRTLTSNSRPVPLEFGVIDRRGTFQYIDEVGSESTRQLLDPDQIRRRRANPSAQDVIVPLLQKLLLDGQERIIVFRSKRGEAEGSSQYLAHDLNLPPAQAAMMALPSDDLSNSSPLLREALRGGVAFHDSNLNVEERVVVETNFRKADGEIRVLTATSGLAAGINTPASTVLIVETNVATTGNPPLPASDVRNMAGRAGRFGYQERGKAIILADSAMARTTLFQRYVKALPEPIRSSFNQRDIPTWVLRLLRQVNSIARHDVAALLINTFGGYESSRQSPHFAAQATAEIDQLVQRMVTAALLVQTGDRITLTMLGNACGSSTLAFESCLRVTEFVARLGQRAIPTESLIVALQVLPEGDEIYVPLQRRGTAEGRWQQAFAARFGPHMLNDLSRFAADTFSFWARCKRSLIVDAWSTGDQISQIENRFSVNPFNRVAAGDVRRIAESTRFRLRSVYEIVAAAAPGFAPDAEAIDKYLAQVEFGIPREGLYLLDIPVTLSRPEILSILGARILSREQLNSMDRNDLQHRLSSQLVQKLKPDRRD